MIKTKTFRIDMTNTTTIIVTIAQMAKIVITTITDMKVIISLIAIIVITTKAVITNKYTINSNNKTIIIIMKNKKIKYNCYKNYDL